jgi:hypothetical protein
MRDAHHLGQEAGLSISALFFISIDPDTALLALSLSKRSSPFRFGCNSSFHLYEDEFFRTAN